MNQKKTDWVIVLTLFGLKGQFTQIMTNNILIYF